MSMALRGDIVGVYTAKPFLMARPEAFGIDLIVQEVRIMASYICPALAPPVLVLDIFSLDDTLPRVNLPY